jgi:hypothetical protein
MKAKPSDTVLLASEVDRYNDGDKAIVMLMRLSAVPADRRSAPRRTAHYPGHDELTAARE